MPLTRQIIRNFLSLFVSNIAGQLFVLWSFVHIARVFGPEGFGKFSFAQVIALHFLYLADFGLQTLGTRVVAQEKNDISGRVWNITLLRIILAAMCFAFLVLFSIILPKPSDVRLLIIIFGIVLLPSSLLFEWVFLGLEKMEIVGLGRIIKGVVFAGLVFLFVDDPGQLKAAAMFYVSGILVSTGVLLGIYFKTFGLKCEQLNSSYIKNTLVTAIPFAAGSLITQLNFNFGILAIGFFLSDEIVGLYSAAYKIVLFLLAFAVVAAANSVFPLMAKSYKQSLSLFGDSLKKLLRIFVLIAIPIGVGGSILASRIMEFLYSAEYQKAVIVFQIAIWIVVIAIFRVVFENAHLASKSQRSYLVGHMLAGTMTVLGNVLLIPQLGMVAPAIVGIIAEFALLIYFVASCKHIRLTYILQVTIKPLLAGLVMGVTLILLPLNLFMALCLGIVVYFVLLIVLRCLTLEELSSYAHALMR